MNNHAIPLMFLLLATAGFAHGPECGGETKCECGSYVTSDYVLTGNMTCPDEISGLELGAGASIDCQGHTINGSGSVYYYGISIKDSVNSTLKNCNIKNFYVGVIVTSSPGTKIIANSISNAGKWGVLIQRDSNYSIVQENNITDCAYEYPDAAGLQLSASDVLVYGNMFWNNSVDAYEVGESLKNDWNLSEYGNCWSSYDGNGTYWIAGPGPGVDHFPRQCAERPGELAPMPEPEAVEETAVSPLENNTLKLLLSLLKTLRQSLFFV